MGPPAKAMFLATQEWGGGDGRGQCWDLTAGPWRAGSKDSDSSGLIFNLS